MDSFYEKGLHFECTRCSRCCRIKPGFVYLSRKDLTNLCIWFKLNDKSFIEKYCRWVHYHDDSIVLCLKETEKYDCVLWDDGCTAYENRPLQCSTYPFWSFLLESERDWNENEKCCPGINKGMLHTKKEIEEQLAFYEDNEPLRRLDYIKTADVIGEEQ